MSAPSRLPLGLVLGLLEKLNQQREHSPVDAVLDYIHTHYS